MVKVAERINHFEHFSAAERQVLKEALEERFRWPWLKSKAKCAKEMIQQIDMLDNPEIPYPPKKSTFWKNCCPPDRVCDCGAATCFDNDVYWASPGQRHDYDCSVSRCYRGWVRMNCWVLR